MYIENPKTRGSGVYCAIPQKGTCPNNCSDCFFQSGRSYLEPLDQNLPNIPPPDLVENRVVRVNDGNDSNVDRDTVLTAGSQYKMKFYNTAIPKNLSDFDGPVVLTVNPGKMTNEDAHFVTDKNDLNHLMFVRFRTNMWNLHILEKVVAHYAVKEVPVVLTFMAYHDGSDIPCEFRTTHYIERKRTTNTYWAITTDAWESVMARYKRNVWVYSCGKIEGEQGKTGCRWCGNCLREYFATMERLRSSK